MRVLPPEEAGIELSDQFALPPSPIKNVENALITQNLVSIRNAFKALSESSVSIEEALSLTSKITSVPVKDSALVGIIQGYGKVLQTNELSNIIPLISDISLRRSLYVIYEIEAPT